MSEAFLGFLEQNVNLDRLQKIRIEFHSMEIVMSDDEKIELLPGINKELLDRVTGILGEYPLKDIVYTLWYILMTINVSIVNSIDDSKK